MRCWVLQFIFILLLLPVSGCDYEQSSLRDPVPAKELLLYCGTTIAPAMRHIADVFEQQHGCVVKIIRDGSGVLQHSIRVNKVGDLYLPGTESYVEKCAGEGMVLEAHDVGINRAVLMVAPGNPLHIEADLHNFASRRYRTALGFPESGSIGKETKRLLEPLGIYDQALAQAILIARDSKDITQAVAEDRADLALNWYAAALSDPDRQVEVLELDSAIARPHRLRLALLSCSYDKALARKFVTFVLSSPGQQVLASYGFKESGFRGQP